MNDDWIEKRDRAEQLIRDKAQRMILSNPSLAKTKGDPMWSPHGGSYRPEKCAPLIKYLVMEVPGFSESEIEWILSKDAGGV